MNKARHHWFFTWFFHRYFSLISRFFFCGTRIQMPDFEADRPILLLQNHFSWWDGYWSYCVSQKVFRKKFHVMMQEDQLRKHKFLSRCGAFAVRKRSKNMLEALDYSLQILQQKENLLAMFPQGKIESHYVQQYNFEKGVEWITSRMDNQALVFFAVVRVDYFSRIRPEVSIYLKEYSGNATLDDMQHQYNEFARQCNQNQRV